MLTPTQGLLLFAAYALLIVGLVWVTRRKDGGVDDFLVMGRTLGVGRGSISIAVSWIWAPAVFICAQQAYQQGLPGIFWFTAPNILTFFVFVPIALRLRKNHPTGYTVSEVFRERFAGDKRAHLAALVVVGGYQLGAIIINCVAGATLIELLSGIPYVAGVLMMATLALSYSLISGLRGSVLSDVAQMGLILLIALILVPWVLVEAGGGAVLRAGLGGVSGEYGNLFHPGVAFSFGIASTIGLISGPVADQMFAQRAYAAREDAIKKIFAYGGLIFGIVPIVLSLLGFVGAGAVATGQALVVTDPQMVGPEVVGFFLPTWALMLFAVMAFAGLTSTLDSAFTATGSLWSVDLLPYRKKTSRRVTVRGARSGMFLLASLGVFVALLQPELIWVFLIYGALAASLFIPLILALFWKATDATAVFLGISSGVIIGTPLAIYANVTGDAALVVASATIGLVLPGLVTWGVTKTRTD